jgi:hypothetical protein
MAKFRPRDQVLTANGRSKSQKLGIAFHRNGAPFILTGTSEYIVRRIPA